MGCDCCKKWDMEAEKCTASLKFRRGFCDVNTDRGTNHLPKKKKRRKK